MYTREQGGARRAGTPKGTADLHVHLVGPHPILQHFLDRMGFSRIIRACLGRPREGILDHAQTLSVLVQNILLSPAPLYRIAEWASPVDPIALGLTAVEKESLNDDRVARSLDALSSVRARNMFFRLALHIIKQFELETCRIHHDTTTVTFQGRYASSFREPRITHGINKDHRPDLKQLVFGINVTADGAVPISHEVCSGNRTDDTIHRGNVDYLRQLLGRDDFIYVADSKLCTRKNLAHVAGYGGKFVTILPRTRAEDRQFRDALRQGKKVRWRKLLEIENKRRKSDPPDVYHTTADGPNLTDDGYRIIWCRSSQKAVVDTLARETALQKAEVDLVGLSNRLNRGRLRQPSAIKKEIKRVLREHDSGQFLQVTVDYTIQIQRKRLHRGRPKAGESFKEIRSRYYYLNVRRNKQHISAEARTDGIFPIVTNLEPRQMTKQNILLVYKYQPYLEKRHTLFKTELEIAPVYIKKPLRAAGLLHATFLAMILDALIERALRQGMQRYGIETIPILPEGRMTKTPTTARLLEMFSGVSWYEFQRGGETVTFPIQLSDLQLLLLRLLDMDPSYYF